MVVEVAGLINLGTLEDIKVSGMVDCPLIPRDDTGNGRLKAKTHKVRYLHSKQSKMMPFRSSTLNLMLYFTPAALIVHQQTKKLTAIYMRAR